MVADQGNLSVLTWRTDSSTFDMRFFNCYLFRNVYDSRSDRAKESQEGVAKYVARTADCILACTGEKRETQPSCTVLGPQIFNLSPSNTSEKVVCIASSHLTIFDLNLVITKEAKRTNHGAS